MEEKRKNLEKLITNFMESAQERLKSAELLLKSGQFRDSLSRSYYAFLDAADALLLTKKLRPKSHAGSITLFSAHFIKKGVIDKKYGRWFGRIERARWEADYEREKTFTREDAEEVLKEAKEFVKAVEKLWPKLLKK